MIYVCKPAKVALYINTGRKTTAQIKAETGCTALINGGLFDMSSFTPVCHLKVDGQLLVKDRYKYWGFGWNKNDLVLTEDYSKYENYICCVCMVKDGQAEKMHYSSDLGGYRPRTALGVFEDGRVWLYAETTGKTPEQLQKYALSQGVKHAIMLDGGGSTQGAAPGTIVNASRIVHNYICVWEETTQGGEDMTETELRTKVIEIAKGWLGKNEADGSFKEIIDLYNRYTPLPVGYKVKYTDEWCATFVSAVFIKAGKTAIGFPECSCERMIQLYKAAGRWHEDENYTPKTGDVIMYDWQDSGTGDNTGWADHVGIVEKVSGSTMTIIEGNKGNAVSRRTIAVNAKLIRGYCLPDYGSVTKTPTESPETPSAVVSSAVSVSVPLLQKGAKNGCVKALQILLNGRGYNCGTADGDFGTKTRTALIAYQKARGLTADGVAGSEVWNSILK